jgi:hypothetical protein
MKTTNILYWLFTGLITLGMGLSSVMYLSGNSEITTGFQTIGIPGYFIPFLGIAKLLGAIALIAPIKKEGLKEWAYAGFAFTFIGATWVHLSTHTPFMGPLFFLIILGVSYWMRLRKQQLAVAA